LLTRLAVGELSFEADGRTTRMAVCGGYAEVLRHRVRVLADTCELAQEIDLERARRSRERAEAALARDDLSGREFELAEFRLKRALTRIEVHGRQAS
jgi:F-type H+-transporting ATPase subunit epsilon